MGSKIVENVKGKLRDYLTEFELKPYRGRKCLSIRVWRERIKEAAGVMFNEFGARLSTISCVEHASFMEIIYHLPLDREGIIVNLRIDVPKTDLTADSITPIIAGADFIEREIHDLFGVEFKGHPSLKRVILADTWPEGVHPLRKSGS